MFPYNAQTATCGLTDSTGTRPHILILKPNRMESTTLQEMADLNEIRRMYEMVDENADGEVSVSEICGFMNKLRIPISEEDVRFMLSTSLQKDCSGLRFEQFVEVYQSILNNKDHKARDDSEDLMEAFGVFDENKDGYLTSEELQHVLSTMGLIPWSQDLQQCEQMICRFDLDGNGVLDFAEFKIMMSSEPSP
ncbi:calmodulin-like protein 2 [Cryptomeria japonica]|uniref:calmodulin-like protein 2 n=1 Tax=Cryptomeria japonica TaxID=3369 RepID=UPI0025AD8132|nr:calmodulin-like protein 2 [Cryptomeria japonica]